MTAQWQYSVRWGNRYAPCPGAYELACEVVIAGERCPEWLTALATDNKGYVINIDFPDVKPIRRWSDERKAAARKRNLIRRVMNAAPLFADELIAGELAARPDYYSGKSVR
ncbi:theronine dehydrogenase [Siccibacter turicensis]|uniref:theronine dehydrogenase n=1 Tax=Siccibacter turicensis TaxID=357233 RepID=UPI003F5758B6